MTNRQKADRFPTGYVRSSDLEPRIHGHEVVKAVCQEHRGTQEQQGEGHLDDHETSAQPQGPRHRVTAAAACKWRERATTRHLRRGCQPKVEGGADRDQKREHRRSAVECHREAGRPVAQRKHERQDLHDPLGHQ